MSRLNDWKKQAALQVEEDDNIERAFAQQAYSIVANKAGDLAQSPYKVGFEVVYKNDNNTRLVGIFAFRVDKSLFYVPVFFMNGEVKGADMIYNTDTQTFSVLTPEQAQFLIEENTDSLGIGEGIPRSQTNRFSQNGLSLDKLVGSGIKMGSWMSKDNLQFPAILEERGFIGLGLLEEMMCKSAAFTEAVLSVYGKDMLDHGAFMKRAAERGARQPKTRPALVKVAALDAEIDLSADEMSEFFEKGAAIADRRTEDELTQVVMGDANEHLMESITAAGKNYDVLLADATTLPNCLVAAKKSDMVDTLTDNEIGGSNTSEVPEDVVIYDPASQSYKGVSGYARKSEPLLGECSKEDFDPDSYKTLSAGSVYLIGRVTADGRVCADAYPVYIRNVKDIGDGVKTVSYSHSRADDATTTDRTWNPSMEADEGADGVWDAGFFFLPIKVLDGNKEAWSIRTPEFPALATGQSFERWLRKSGAYDCRLKRAGDEYQLATHGGVSRYLFADEMTDALTRQLGVAYPKAVEVMKAAAAQSVIRLLVEPQEGRYKQAAINLLDAPMDLQDDPDGDFYGFPIHGDKMQVLMTETDKPDFEEQDMMDVWDPALGNSLPNSVLSEADPEAIQALLKLQGIPKAFDHGLIGTLAKTYDSVEQAAKYIEGIDQGVDSLGRILFLMYWKPADFQDAYGADDVGDLEQQMLSSFKALGAIQLQLKKKSNKLKRESHKRVQLPVD